MKFKIRRIKCERGHTFPHWKVSISIIGEEYSMTGCGYSPKLLRQMLEVDLKKKGFISLSSVSEGLAEGPSR